MKNYFTIILSFFFGLTFGQTGSNKVKEIHNTVEQINRDTGYTTRTLDNEEFLDHMTDNGESVTGYFKNGQLVKIVEWIGLSSCINITEYYFKDDTLIFAYTQGKVFQYIDSTASFNYNVQNIVMECRFYFDNNKLIKSIFNGSTVCSGEPSDSWAKNYQSDCEEYIKLFRKK